MALLQLLTAGYPKMALHWQSSFQNVGAILGWPRIGLVVFQIWGLPHKMPTRGHKCNVYWVVCTAMHGNRLRPPRNINYIAHAYYSAASKLYLSAPQIALI